MNRKPRPLDHLFEDELGHMVDDYLLQGINPDALKRILRYEADMDHIERLKELHQREQGVR